MRQLGAFLSTPSNPLVPVLVLVHSHGLGTWLEQQLAHALGLCANVQFIQPMELVQRVRMGAGGWSRQTPVWTLLDLLLTHRDDPALAEVRTWSLLGHGRCLAPRGDGAAFGDRERRRACAESPVDIEGLKDLFLTRASVLPDPLTARSDLEEPMLGFCWGRRRNCGLERLSSKPRGSRVPDEVGSLYRVKKGCSCVSMRKAQCPDTGMSNRSDATVIDPKGARVALGRRPTRSAGDDRSWRCTRR